VFRQLNRTSTHRMHMFRNMLTSLVEHERIVTTTARAKEVQRLADKLITTVKRGLPAPAATMDDSSPSLCSPSFIHARRQVNKILYTPESQTKVMNILGPRYQWREGGYTRVLKLSQFRQGDRADMSVLEFVDHAREIRAARPPSKLREQLSDDLSLEAMMKQLGISPKIPASQSTTA
jgi:large subunit ribosomal protein L17